MAVAASVDYCMYSGYACLAYLLGRTWLALKGGGRGGRKLCRGHFGRKPFYQAKLQTARFYFRVPAALPHCMLISMLSA